MSNPRYWEDSVSTNAIHGRQTEMVVDQHAPSFSVNWGTGKYDHVQSDHSNLTGGVSHMHTDTCTVCGRYSQLSTLGVCPACVRSQHVDEQERMRRDQAMGSHKRSSPLSDLVLP